MSGVHIDDCREQISKLNKPDKFEVAEVLEQELEHIHDGKAIDIVEEYIESGELVLDENQNVWISGKEPLTYGEWVNLLEENEDLTALEVVDVLVSKRPILSENDAYDIIEYGLDEGIIIETEGSPRGIIQPGSSSQPKKPTWKFVNPVQIIGILYLLSLILPYLSPRIHFFVAENPIDGTIEEYNIIIGVIDIWLLGSFPTTILDILLIPFRHILLWMVAVITMLIVPLIIILGVLMSTNLWKDVYPQVYRTYIVTCALLVIYVFILAANTPYAMIHVGGFLFLISTLLFPTASSITLEKTE